MHFEQRPSRQGGVLIHGVDTTAAAAVAQRFAAHLQTLGLDSLVACGSETSPTGSALRFWLNDASVQRWAPGYNTLELCTQCGLDTLRQPDDLAREIILAMLLGPVAFEFPDLDEWLAAIRIRQNIVHAARKTSLAFHTSEAERPEDYWAYSPATGFTILPGTCLIDALCKATQPDVSGKLYSFSCYRASEYVILLSIAQELRASNPALLHALQQHYEKQAIQSGKFHDVFLREYGSMEQPLPPKYYVPGDRLWFRNPDEHSSDVSGYEGSWVFYLGGGLFCNFWNHAQPFTLSAKCIEIYHWRHATYVDPAGDLRIDETIVAHRVADTQRDPLAVQNIFEQMLRLREPKGVYQHGGCIDTTREYPRWVRPGTSDMVLPRL